MKNKWIIMLACVGLFVCGTATAKNKQKAPKQDEVAEMEQLLAEKINEMRESLPVDLEYGSMMTQVALEDGYLTLVFECDEDYIDIDALNANLPELKEEEIVEFIDPDLALLLECCIVAHKGFAYKYIGKSSGKICNLLLPYEELCVIKEELPLRRVISAAAAKFPIPMGNGLTMIDCMIDGDYFIYVVECEDDDTVATFMSTKWLLKSTILKACANSSNIKLTELCLQAHKGTGYKYIGKNTGETCVVLVTYEELEAAYNEAQAKK